MKKIDKLEKFLRSEIEPRDKLSKRFKRRATATTFSDGSVVAVISALKVDSLVTLMTGSGMPLSVVLASTGLLLGIGFATICKTQRVSDSKAKKHDKIKALAKSKLDTISGIVSKGIKGIDACDWITCGRVSGRAKPVSAMSIR